jgi:hypothetical protein
MRERMRPAYNVILETAQSGPKLRVKSEFSQKARGYHTRANNETGSSHLSSDPAIIHE